MFEQAFEKYYKEQMSLASGRRLERLRQVDYGEKLLFSHVLWPVFQSFDGFEMEYELKNMSGISVYVDAMYVPLRLAFECEGFVPHAEKVTRDRFSFEKERARAIAFHKCKYVPFSRDEMKSDSAKCQRHVYELLGRYSGSDDAAIRELTVYEREVIRYAIYLNKPFKLADACYCLQLQEDTARKVLRTMLEKRLIQPVGQGTKTIRFYKLTERAKDYLL